MLDTGQQFFDKSDKKINQEKHESILNHLGWICIQSMINLIEVQHRCWRMNTTFENFYKSFFKYNIQNNIKATILWYIVIGKYSYTLIYMNFLWFFCYIKNAYKDDKEEDGVL